MVGEPVRAEYKDVAGLQAALLQFDLRVVTHPESPGDDVAARPGRHLPGAEEPALEQVAPLGVIAGELEDGTISDTVDAAVAGPHAGVVAPENQQHGHGRTYHDAPR